MCLFVQYSDAASVEGESESKDVENKADGSVQKTENSKDDGDDDEHEEEKEKKGRKKKKRIGFHDKRVRFRNLEREEKKGKKKKKKLKIP